MPGQGTPGSRPTSLGTSFQGLRPARPALGSAASFQSQSPSLPPAFRRGLQTSACRTEECSALARNQVGLRPALGSVPRWFQVTCRSRSQCRERKNLSSHPALGSWKRGRHGGAECRSNRSRKSQDDAARLYCFQHTTAGRHGGIRVQTSGEPHPGRYHYPLAVLVLIRLFVQRAYELNLPVVARFFLGAARESVRGQFAITGPNALVVSRDIDHSEANTQNGVVRQSGWWRPAVQTAHVGSRHGLFVECFAHFTFPSSSDIGGSFFLKARVDSVHHCFRRWACGVY